MLALAATLAVAALSAHVDIEIDMAGGGRTISVPLEIVQQPDAGDESHNFVVIANHGSDDMSFIASYNGDIVRFKEGKMREGKWQEDFAADPYISLLPAFVESQIAAIRADSASSIEERRQADGAVYIKGETRSGDYVVREFSYTLTPAGLPSEIEIITSPDQPFESSISANYTYPGVLEAGQIDRAYLESQFPEVFAKFSQENFGLKSLEGEPLPSFSLPGANGNRITHQRGEGFREPTIFIAAEDVLDIEEPVGFDVVYIVENNRLDEFDSSKSIAMNGRSFFRDCGIKSPAAAIVCSEKGIVEKICEGSNKDIEKFVLNLQVNK